ncbi:MAG: WG repeat-containing protein [Desulfuromonadaceae bacterium]
MVPFSRAADCRYPAAGQAADPGSRGHPQDGYKAGKLIIPPRYNGVQPFSEGLAVVKLGDKYGYIDRSGKMVIPPPVYLCRPFFQRIGSGLQ